MSRKTADRRMDPTSEEASMVEIARYAETVVRRVAPALRVERHWGHPWLVGRDLVCAIGAFSQHAGVEFWRGSTIPDPDHLLEGTGKNLRHVKLRTLQEASTPRFARLIRSAVALDRTESKRTR